MVQEARCIAIPPGIKHRADWSRFKHPWDGLGPKMAEEVREQVRRDLIAKREREAGFKSLPADDD